MSRPTHSRAKPAAQPVRENECCGSCRCFTPPKPAPENMAMSQLQMSVFQYGTCRRYPTPISKKPDDWCFEHKPGGAS